MTSTSKGLSFGTDLTLLLYPNRVKPRLGAVRYLFSVNRFAKIIIESLPQLYKRYGIMVLKYTLLCF